MPCTNQSQHPVFLNHGMLIVSDARVMPFIGQSVLTRDQVNFSKDVTFEMLGLLGFGFWGCLLVLIVT